MADTSGGAKKLGVFTLAMINVAIICSLRGLPMMAEEGLSLVAYYAVGALFFLIPVSLVSAELATGWPPNGPGGVYVWVKEALGERWGFVAIWLQWAQNVIWYPTALSFVAATVAYAFNPSLAENKFFTLAVILAVYWGGTFANFFGMRTSSLVSVLGASGSIALALLISALGVIFLATGGTSEIPLDLHSMVPDLSSMDRISFLAGVLVIVSGMEVSAVHAQDVDNPRHSYPKAIFLAAGMTMTMLIFGSLAIAVVVPAKEISLVAGLMEGFEKFFEVFNMRWLVPVVALFIVAGQLGEICSWIVGPSKGLFRTAADGLLPRMFQRTNSKGVTVNILLMQALIVTALVLVFLFMPSVSSAYWILTALTAQLYVGMYLLLFISAIVLRYTRPNTERKYSVPGGNAGMWLTAGAGLLGGLFVFVLGFYPPDQIATGSPVFYELFLFGGIAVMCGAPLLIFALRRPGWKPAAPVFGEGERRQ